MATATAPRPQRKGRNRYHHGDLRRALIDEAVRTIQDRGVAALTLRDVGTRLGVSRTALYRHFSDKSALLGAVAAEGFRQLRDDLLEAWEEGGHGRTGFELMGIAYVRFAIVHPSHYRVMFGGLVQPKHDDDCQLEEQAKSAFDALVHAIVEQQQQGLVRDDDPQMLARFIWATVHGIAMLGIDGQLRPEDGGADVVMLFANERLRTGIALPQPAPRRR